MGQATEIYKCPTCGATKELRSHQVNTHVEFKEAYASMPDKIICGWRGCLDYAVKEVSTKGTAYRR